MYSTQPALQEKLFEFLLLLLPVSTLQSRTEHKLELKSRELEPYFVPLSRHRPVCVDSLHLFKKQSKVWYAPIRMHCIASMPLIISGTAKMHSILLSTFLGSGTATARFTINRELDARSVCLRSPSAQYFPCSTCIPFSLSTCTDCQYS